MKKELMVELARYRLATGGEGVSECNDVILLNKLEMRDGEIVVPSFVNTIGSGTPVHGQPSGCFALKIPSGVSSINTSAFANSSIEELVIESGAFQSIGVSAFKWSKIRSVALPYGLSSIGSRAFEGCDDLESIDLPDTVYNIGSHAFASSGIRGIVVPESVQDVGVGAFSGCSSLRSVVWDADCGVPRNAFLNSDVEEITLGFGVRYIDNSAFSGCKELENVAIPSSCTDIYNFAFHNCYRLRRVDFCEADGRRTLHSNAFSNCSDLVSIELARGTELGSGVFSGCTSLEEVSVWGGTGFDSAIDAFRDCESLRVVRLMSNICTAHGTSVSKNDMAWLRSLLRRELFGIGATNKYNRNIVFEVPHTTYEFLRTYYSDLMKSYWYTIVDSAESK